MDGLVKPGHHGTTFGGNPVACRLGLAVLDELVEGGLVAKVAETGEWFGKKLAALKKRSPAVVDVRGAGLIRGIELDREAAPVQKRLLEKGFVVGTARKTVIRLLPPYVIPKAALVGLPDRPRRNPEGRCRMSTPKIKKAALAYSGGLDTSIIIPWLKENYGCEVVAVAVDVGQAEETAGLKEKALATGACDFHLIDAREEFAAEYLWRVLRAGAVYEHEYLLGTSTARPLIAKKQVEIALQTGCDALSHGCTGKGNDQVRFELAYQSLAPELTIIAPWREWSITSREEAIDYAAERNIPVPVDEEGALLARPEPLAHLARGRAARGPGVRARGVDVQADRRPAEGARRARVRDDRLRRGLPGRGERKARSPRPSS